MIFLVLTILIEITCCINTSSSLFHNHFSRRDLTSLRVMQLFEELIPPAVAPDKINDNYVKDLLGYFNHVLEAVAKNNDATTGLSPKDLLAETIGSHMRSEILPASRLAYYAGYISFRKARDLHDFYNDIKIMLNTQGLGWKLPARVKKWGNLTMEKLKIGFSKYENPCALLIFKRDTRSCIYLPPPKLDDKVKPSAIALPFKTGGLVNLESPISENALLKYYTTGSRCILHSSPANCRHSDFVAFNNDLWHWMKRDVAPHLIDEKLYSAFGGVLRVAAAVQSYGKGLSRRNTFSYRDCETKWRTVPDDSVDDPTSYLYMLLVLSVATVVCLLQVIYSNVFNEGGICRCKCPHKVDVEYASVPGPLAGGKEYGSKGSTHTVRTQKVYDMHENKEEDMAIQEYEDSESSMESVIIKELEKKNMKSLSPPRIETSISEIRIPKKPPMSRKSYSIHSVTDSSTYLREETSSESSFSEESFSTSSKKRRSPRDLAWARRVLSKQKLYSNSGTYQKSSNT